MAENKIIASKCVTCGSKYWSTEGYEAMVRAGLREDICFSCENPKGENPKGKNQKGKDE